MAVTRQDLERQVSELGREYPKRNEPDLFALWVMFAYATNDRSQAHASLTGGSGEKAIDALYIDDATDVVVVCQAKYREGIGKADEIRATLLEFAKVAEKLFAEDEAFETFADSLEPIAKDKIRSARKAVIEKGYSATFLFATTGRASTTAIEEASEEVAFASSHADLVFIDGERILQILGDFLDGVAPPIPSLQLPLADDNHLYLVDKARGIQSWVISMTGHEVAGLYEKADIRLFARNIRGYLGETRINEQILETVSNQPDNFFYFNNGVTVVCDGADMKKINYEDVLLVRNPQIINGQQTTRSLAASPATKRKKTRVLVKVIKIPRTKSSPSGSSQYESIVGRIVEAANSQNAIKPSDLKANHRIQLDLEYELRLLHYFYQRKRMSKQESRRIHGNLYNYYLSKFDMARAVGACIEPGLPLRRGQEPLFDQHYNDIFTGRSVDQFLSMYWFWKIIESEAYGVRERTYAKWVVAFRVWEAMEQSLYGSRDFIEAAQKWDNNGRPLLSKTKIALGYAFELADKFYRAELRSGSIDVEPDTFWKNQTSYQGFWDYLKKDQRRVPKLKRLIKAASKELTST